MGSAYEPRVHAGDLLQLYTASTYAAVIGARASILYDSGADDVLTVPERTLTDTSIGAETSRSTSVARADGRLVDAAILARTAGKRGQTYARLDLIRGGGIHAFLISGYIHDSVAMPLGKHEQPVSGKGWLSWVQEGNDVAGNVATTVNLAKTNARRMVRGVIIKYHQTGGGAITLNVTLRDLADSGGPTNWSIDSDTWVSPDLTLGANEEGLIHVGEHGFVSTNDAGTIAYADNTSAPNPFPLEVNEDDPVDLLVSGGGAAGDDYDVWIHYEEWVDV